ncbi:MAG: hypothetical protein GF390_02265, partial [Candidatus Pacebacteria bacterium]|nr:hypothetical protein [Candidatus Paceibacterota bacterium]
MTKKILLIILFTALLLRVIFLASLPHGFQNDEASFFYNAIALKQTLKD